MQRNCPCWRDLLKTTRIIKTSRSSLVITLLHRGTERLGFTAIEMKPGLFRTLTGWYERWLLALFHPYGSKVLKTYRKKLTPKYLVMTRQELINRYYHPGKQVTGNREDF